jgi:tRNA dimethylallyltransferase
MIMPEGRNDQSAQSEQHPLLVAIVGATAVGKTDLAIGWARRFAAEIISADSRQVYRRMDIGTAKPTAAEQAAAPHHLIDVCDPDDPFSLATYQELALAAINDVVARGKPPLLVGGTGQYLAALLEGWQVPRVAPDPQLRAELEQEAQRSGVDALHARLAEVDPAAAERIAPSNVRRVIRALEVFLLSGSPMSLQQARREPPFRIRTIWLSRPRAELYRRADQRVDAMMAAGLLDEVAGLLRAGYTWELPAMSSLGYLQFRPYFEATATLEACVQQLKFDTHRFIRRQHAWFRRLPQLEIWEPDRLEWREWS